MTTVRAFLLAMGLITAACAYAHEGHDHGTPTAPAAVALAPRSQSVTADFELVAVAEGARLVLYLDRFATNEPVAGATVDVAAGSRQERLKETSPGTYEAEAAWLEIGKRNDFVVTVEAAGTSDLLPVTLDIPAGQPGDAPPGPEERFTRYATWGGAAVLLLALGYVAMGRKRRGTPPAALGVLLLLTLIGPPTDAHEGHDHGPQAPPSNVSQPARLPDGSVFIPKPSQRVLGIRTIIAARGTASASVELNGHVIADPNGAGRVQAPQPGRIEPGPRGLPHLGKAVDRGEVLAYVVPTVSALDAANQRAQLADLAAQLELARQRHARVAQLDGSVPRKDIEAAANAVRALEQRRAAAGEGLGARIALIAPVAGRVSTVAAAAGQVVDARDTLFEIVDPARLIVEALAYDPKLPGQIRGAAGVTSDGRSIELAMLGHGAVLREHALPVAFRIRSAADALAVGQPVRVLARIGEPRDAVLVPAEAIVRDSTGAAAVWVHPDAERFVLKRARVSALDATRFAVHEGLEPNERVVTRGATLLGQVR